MQGRGVCRVLRELAGGRGTGRRLGEFAGERDFAVCGG